MTKQDIGKALNRRLVRTSQTAEAYNLLITELRVADKQLKVLRKLNMCQAEGLALHTHAHEIDKLVIDNTVKMTYLFAANLMDYGSHRYDCEAPKQRCSCGYGSVFESAKENNAIFDSNGPDFTPPVIPVFKKGHLTVVSDRPQKKQEPA